MTKYVENLQVIYKNPFILAPLITNFYSNIGNKPNNILLCYLIFPMVLDEDRRDYLLKSSINSSIYTFKSRKNLLVGISSSLTHFKSLTSSSLQHAIDNNWVIVNNDMSISVVENQENIQEHLGDAYRATAKLNNIFGSVDVVSIYKFLGVKEL